jgi:hypothetical protein
LNETKTTSELLQELIINMKGLRTEVEAWRIHTSSGGTFILDVLDGQISIIEELASRAL